MNYYDVISNSYNKLYAQEQKQKYNSIKDLIPKTGKTLDLGCGTGIITKLIKNCIGIDSSKKMLEKCDKDLEIYHADIIKLPFKDNSFDNIISLTVLQDIENIKKAVKEIKRVLKINGKIVITVLNKNRIKIIEKELFSNFKNLKKKEIKKDIVFFN